MKDVEWIKPLHGLTEPTSTVYDSYATFLWGNEGTLSPVKKCIGLTVLDIAILAQDGYFLH